MLMKTAGSGENSIYFYGQFQFIFKNMSLKLNKHQTLCAIGSGNMTITNKDYLRILSILALFSCAVAFNTKIVNGSLALPGEFPYMVSLEFEKNMKQLITNRIR